MAKLDELQQGAAIRGVLPDCLVTVINAQWFGSEALELTYKDSTGKLANELLYRHDEPRLQVVSVGRPWSFDADGHLFRLVSEAHRIRLAHLFDPVLAGYSRPSRQRSARNRPVMGNLSRASSSQRTGRVAISCESIPQRDIASGCAAKECRQALEEGPGALRFQGRSRESGWLYPAAVYRRRI